MNGPTNAVTERYLGPESSSLGGNRSVLTGVETANSATGAGTIRQVSNGSVGGFASLREGIAGLGLGRGKGVPGNKSPANVKEEMEVEMQ